MHYLVSLAIIILLSSYLFVGALRAGGSGTTNSKLSQKGWFKDRPTGVGAKSQLSRLLTELAKSTPPSKVCTGAMCYSLMEPTGIRSVVCSSCGSRTVYDTCGAYNHSDLMNAIRLAQGISNEMEGLTVTVDTSRFCAKCAKDKPMDDTWDELNESLKKQIVKLLAANKDKAENEKILEDYDFVSIQIGQPYEEAFTIRALKQALSDLQRLKTLKSKNFMDKLLVTVTFDGTNDSRKVVADIPTLKALLALIKHERKIRVVNDREFALKDFESKLRKLLDIPK